LNTTGCGDEYADRILLVGRPLTRGTRPKEEKKEKKAEAKQGPVDTRSAKAGETPGSASSVPIKGIDLSSLQIRIASQLSQLQAYI
jgi:hypothetical protein